MWRKIFWGKKLPRRFVFGVGLYTIGYNIYDVLDAPVRHNMEETNNMKRYGQGTYAVVTGASNPTGRAFCDRLSKEGYKLVLVDDCGQERLDELSKTYGGAPAFHFNWKRQTTWQEYEALCNQIQQAASGSGETGSNEISILVNNVEKIDPRKGKVYKASDDELLETANANTFPMTFMMRFLGP